MQLTASTIDWKKLENLKFDKPTDEVLMLSCEDLEIGVPPWPSDSALQVFELSECFVAIKETLAPATRIHADRIMSTLIHKSYMFPWELGSCPRGEYFIGTISPSTVREYMIAFSQLNYIELDEAFDSRMPINTRKEFEIARYRSKEVFTGYLRQWEDLFKYAADRGAGVLIHMG